MIGTKILIVHCVCNRTVRNDVYSFPLELLQIEFTDGQLSYTRFGQKRGTQMKDDSSDSET